MYAPAEDSFLLAEHVAEEKGDLLDMGTGSGVAAISNALSNSGRVVGADISPKAVECARRNAEANGAKAEFVVSDLFSNVGGKFDVICFNPPYLGKDGQETSEDLALVDAGAIGRFLSQFREHLKKGGRLYIVLSTNNPRTNEYIAMMRGMGRLEMVESRRFFFEEIMLFRLTIG